MNKENEMEIRFQGSLFVEDPPDIEEFENESFRVISTKNKESYESNNQANYFDDVFENTHEPIIYE